MYNYGYSKVRNSTTEPKRFRELLSDITGFLLYEATADLELRDKSVTTPMGSTMGKELQEDLAFAPVLRAGLGTIDAALEIIPTARVWHIGLYRDHETLQIMILDPRPKGF